MKEKTALEGLKMLFSGSGPMELSFFGGEPFLRFSMMAKVSRWARRVAKRSGRDLSIQITTNATILEEKQLQYLKEYRVWTALSLDGPEDIQDVARPFVNGRGSGKLVWRNVERALEVLERVHILMVVTPTTIGSILPAVERLYRAGASRISLLPDLEADWSMVETEAQAVWSQLARICLLSMCTDQPLYLSPFSAYFPTSDVLPAEAQGQCDFGGQQVTIAPSGNLYPCARLVGTDRRPEVRIGHVKMGWEKAKAESLKKAGDEGLRQGGCGKGGCQCIPLMPGDTKVQLDHSARFAYWTRDAALPVSREIEEALGVLECKV